MKPNGKLFAWKRCEAYDRIESCRVMLYMHNFLSESENEKVKKRIQKWLDRHPNDQPSEPLK